MVWTENEHEHENMKQADHKNMAKNKEIHNCINITDMTQDRQR